MPKVVDKKEKADQIADAAIKAFSDRGFAATRMADIAKQAAIGKGTIYEYFKDKTDILRYAYNQFYEAFSQGLLSETEGKTRPIDKLLSLISSAIGYISEWEDYCAAYIEYFSSQKKGDVQYSITDLYDQMKAVIMQILGECQKTGDIDESLKSEVIAELFLSFYDGLIVHRILVGKNIDIETLNKGFIDIIKNGLFKVKNI